MSELPDNSDTQPTAAPEATVEELLKPPRKPRKKYKDKRRRPPSGLKGGPQQVLSQIQKDEIKRLLSECYGPVLITRQKSVEWKVSEETMRRAIAEAQAEWAKARDAVPAAERAANVLEQHYRYVRKCYDNYNEGDVHALKGVPAVLDRIARIEGAFAPEKKHHEHDVPSGITIGQMSEANVKSRIAELMRKHGAALLKTTGGTNGT